eukprot:Blabericola_migrator_1__5957@NODE_3000_length_2128_cov_4_408054_g1876_i0_p1_GENE_NODE_3000_length_2128_cov_4_408054_g1876_i0NODE_3000_length_2128_cov_4_408054_g1876_i0_p1_ORF_typecomplete_len131_score5_53_NODE_3000_length_2128_cov_4_408054_g1876_i07681160
MTVKTLCCCPDTVLSRCRLLLQYPMRIHRQEQFQLRRQVDPLVMAHLWIAASSLKSLPQLSPVKLSFCQTLAFSEKRGKILPSKTHETYGFNLSPQCPRSLRSLNPKRNFRTLMLSLARSKTPKTSSNLL